MKQEAYTDLVRSNVQVLLENVTLAMETLEDDNQRLTEQVFKLEKENMRLVTENRMMKEECNHLKAEVIKLLDTVAKCKEPNGAHEPGTSGCDGCEWNNYDTCNPEFEDKDCPDCGCCREYIKHTESDNNETH